ncbi:hypothetical protein [Pseudozobellia sp. WGM2]|uniref:hypothetical protein n=1 Tax=Pseudozobellia sp. WGM2 TaxID=2787625 RepID=UPI001ADFADC4|nr:hypothetical protein [Pseudozobellia sp. WGM2]
MYAKLHKTIRLGVFLLFIIPLLQSCYTTRFVSTHGVPMPPETMQGQDWYRDKMYGEYTAVVKTSVLTDGMMINVPKDKCESGKLFSVEFKDTFGGNLLYLVTFGSRRKVKIKYVCMIPEM